jgi:hypothetical protein
MMTNVESKKTKTTPKEAIRTLGVLIRTLVVRMYSLQLLSETDFAELSASVDHLEDRL